MSNQIIELAIRSPKKGVSETAFVAAKDAAVKKLVSLNGIGPEREFAPFQTMPQKDEKVYLGMTLYASQSKTYRAMMSLGFMVKLMPFMRMMNSWAGIFIKPDNPNFDYMRFANKANITEVALLRPKQGVNETEFLLARTKFLQNLDSEPEVQASYTFTVTGGFKNKDTFPHFTVYKSQADFEKLMERIQNRPYATEFLQLFDAELICFCTTIK